MIQNAERKAKIIAMRLRLLENMKFFLNLYKFDGQESNLDYVKEMGRDSEYLKRVIDAM